MKPLKIKILEFVLKYMAFAVLVKYKPKVVGITGSVGKTSAKEAVFSVLSSKFNVRKNEKNYNNEIGIPLTIIGVETGGRSVRKWTVVFLEWIKLLLKKNSQYPEILILEMGVDRPGDMKYLLSFIKPAVGIVTNISSSHLEFFGSLSNIAKEKGLLVEAIEKDGFAILNWDDDLVKEMDKRTKGKIITFGFDENAEISASNIVYNYDGEKPEGISFKMSFDGASMPIRLNRMLAKHQIQVALSAVAAGIAFKMNAVDISAVIQNFAPPTGRLNLIEGINDSYIIDDTYNASPTSTVAALSVLGEIKAKRKIAVLGDMLELGKETEGGHRAVAKKAFETGVEFFIAVGKRMNFAKEELISLGFAEEKIISFDNSVEAAKGIEDLLGAGDLILIKGSQGMRMEKVVEKLMANSADAEKLLCRQSADWKSKPVGNP